MGAYGFCYRRGGIQFEKTTGVKGQLKIPMVSILPESGARPTFSRIGLPF
jgi:hypothetical protein